MCIYNWIGEDAHAQVSEHVGHRCMKKEEGLLRLPFYYF